MVNAAEEEVAGEDAAVQEEVAQVLGFSNPEEGQLVTDMSQQVRARLNAQALPIRQYLERNVVPTLLPALAALVRERPPNPVEYLAAYLLKNNPKKVSDREVAEAKAAAAEAEAAEAEAAK